MKLTYLSLPEAKDGTPQYAIVLSEIEQPPPGVELRPVEFDRECREMFPGCVGALFFASKVEVQP